MSRGKDIDPDLLAITSSLIGVLLSQGLNSNDINVLGNFLSTIGSALQTISAQMQSQESNSNPSNDIQEQVAHLQDELLELKALLKMND